MTQRYIIANQNRVVQKVPEVEGLIFHLFHFLIQAAKFIITAIPASRLISSNDNDNWQSHSITPTTYNRSRNNKSG